jgi:hypothetical protein
MMRGEINLRGGVNLAIGYSILTRTLLPWLAIRKMRDVEMSITPMVSVRKKDNYRNRSPGEFGWQTWIHRTKSVKIMEVEQCYFVEFFSDGGMPKIRIVACPRQHYGEDALS